MKQPACALPLPHQLGGDGAADSLGDGGLDRGQAGPGWDLVTGWGGPNAQILVPLLAHAAH
jgi:hypothetical protein